MRSLPARRPLSPRASRLQEAEGGVPGPGPEPKGHPPLDPAGPSHVCSAASPAGIRLGPAPKLVWGRAAALWAGRRGG